MEDVYFLRFVDMKLVVREDVSLGKGLIFFFFDFGRYFLSVMFLAFDFK